MHERLKIAFATPRKEAAVAIGFVVGLFLTIGVVFLLLERQAGIPVGTSRQFNLQRALSQYGVYTTISFIPILVIIRTRGQSARAC